MDLTPTALELLSDFKFADKREEELRQYGKSLIKKRQRRELSQVRFDELFNSTNTLREFWSKHANELWVIENVKR